MVQKTLPEARRSSIGITPRSLISLSRLCINVREKGAKLHKHEVISKMIAYFEERPELIEHLL